MSPVIVKLQVYNLFKVYEKTVITTMFLALLVHEKENYNMVK